MKNNKTKTVRTSNAAAPVCVCSRGHRVWSAVALIGLFLCGLMIGMPIGAKHGASQSIRDNVAMVPVDDMPTCARIEQVLSEKLSDTELNNNADTFLYNANIYASMAEYGCPENAEKYREQALSDLAIANALSDNGQNYADYDVASVIDTYKKLEMQTQAREFLNKVQKLTDPAIDFILQMEKIINE